MSLITFIGEKSRVSACFAFTFVIAVGLGFVSGPVQAENLQAKNRIIDLMLCYGEGTDTIALNGPLDERLEEGIEIYRDCFTEDATFNLWLPGSDFEGPPSLPIQGLLPWAVGVVAGNVTPTDVDGNSLVRDQHMLTNFRVETKGKFGTLTAYLNNTRTIYSATDGLPVSNLISNGTYTLYVEKIRGKWMATELDLKLNSVYAP
jgi:hypothetical protein